MKYEYVRIDMIKVIMTNIEQDDSNALDFLKTASDCEYREDYQCFFVRRATPTYTWLAVKYPELIDAN
jgi:hypothetical protein